MIHSFGFFFPGIRKSMLIPSLSCDPLQWRVLAKFFKDSQKYLIWHPSFLEFSKQWKFSKWKISAIFDWIDFKSFQSLQFNKVYSFNTFVTFVTFVTLKIVFKLSICVTRYALRLRRTTFDFGGLQPGLQFEYRWTPWSTTGLWSTSFSPSRSTSQ